METVKSITFFLKNGNEMTLDISEKLLKEIARTFEVDPESVSENQIKYYLTSSIKKALETHESST